ncbi:MAG: SPFH domain-containing protein, partial [Actinomycetota bacterium]
MADITRLPLLRHLRAGPTAYIRDQRNGRLVHEGVGASFWFRPLAAAISEVPVDDRELPLLFHARTRDFQDVSVQAAITFRVVDPAVAAA